MASFLGWCVALTRWHCFPLHRGPPRSSGSDPDFVVVDGVPVMLPSYDEAVSGGLSALGPGYLASVGQGCPLPVDDQSPPAYPGPGDMDTGPGESETCDSVSGSSELLQRVYSSPMCPGGSRPASDNPGTVASTAGEVASTSPGIDIADGKCLPPGLSTLAHTPTPSTRRLCAITEPNQSASLSLSLHRFSVCRGRGQGQLVEGVIIISQVMSPLTEISGGTQGHRAIRSRKAPVAGTWFP